MATLQRRLLGLLLFSMLAVVAELGFLEHTEEWSQRAPFFVLGVGWVCGLFAALRPRPVGLRLFQAAMFCCIGAGVVGSWLHCRGNAEFEREQYPALGGPELVWKSLQGATPALAPLALAQLGLLGLACTYRHPMLAPRTPSAEESKEA